MTDDQLPSRRAARDAAAKPRRSHTSAPTAATHPHAPTASAGTGGGLGGFIRKHPKAMLATALSLAFLLLGGGAVYAGILVGSQKDDVAAPVDVTEDRVVPTDIALPALVRTCSVDDEASVDALQAFSGAVVNAETGEVLFDRSAHVPASTASAMKALVAVAALTTLGPDHRLTTRVYEGSEPGSIVLVGGGDPTLSVLPSSYYPGAPKMSDLANQVKAKWNELHPPIPEPREDPGDDRSGDDPPGEGDERDDEEEEPAPVLVPQPITKVLIDTTMWGAGDRWDAAWPQEERTIGTMPNIVPLMIDGDRSNGRAAVSPRSNDPVGAAANAFVHSLGLSATSVQVASGSAIDTRPLLGEVKSQPLSTLIQQMLADADNTLAEMLARVVSAESGGGGSAASLNQVISGAVSQLGLDTTGLLVKDGSGLNPASAIPPKLIAEVMAKLYQSPGDVNFVIEALPVAGRTGVLSDRFSGPLSELHGAVHAMPGMIASAATLSGVLTAEDGTPLAFSLHALGAVDGTAQNALEALTAAVWRCGNNLSNN